MGTDNLIDLIDEEKDVLACKLDDFDRLDVERRQLIRKLNDENVALKEELHRKTADYAAELRARLDWQKKAENSALITIEHARQIVQSYNHVLVLIDGKHCIFQEKLVQQGMAGGEEAARRLNDEVQKCFELTNPQGAKPCKIMVRVYLDLNALFQTLQQSGLVKDPETIHHFSRGFSQHQPLFDLVDIGYDGEQVPSKIQENLDLSLNNVFCKHILLGCDLPKTLRQPEHRNRIIQLRTDGSKAEPHEPLEVVEFPTVFGSSALPLSIASNDNSEQLAFQPLNNGGLFAESNRSRKHSGSLCSSTSQTSVPPRSKIQGYHASPFPSNESHNRESYEPTIEEGDSTPPPNLPSAWGPNQRTVLLNLDEERVDSYLGPTDQNAVMRVAERCDEQRLCNDFHLRDRCWTPDCPYSHEPRLSMKELVVLRYKARMLVCERGSACRSLDCWYGHMCAAENCRKVNCRFKAVHDIDKTAVRVWQKRRFPAKAYEDFV